MIELNNINHPFLWKNFCEMRITALTAVTRVGIHIALCEETLFPHCLERSAMEQQPSSVSAATGTRSGGVEAFHYVFVRLNCSA